MSGFKNVKMPISNIKIVPKYEFYIDEDFELVRMERKIGVQAAERLDNEIVSSITEIAREQGFTDLVLIDKEFVVTALKNEIERRKRNE